MKGITTVHPEARLMIVSTSKLHGSAYLAYLQEEVAEFFAGVEELLFIPYARPDGLDYPAYTELPRQAFAALDLPVRGIHEYPDPLEAVEQAQAIFIGGGNTFVLLHELYRQKLIKPLQEKIRQGTPYMGSSAGSNVAGISIGTSNDMPIVYPPSFEALALLPFNVNPHYLDPDPRSTHQGETRERRIREFHHYNEQAVIGLREGSWLQVAQGEIQLKGQPSARIFRKGQEPTERPPGLLTL